MQSPRCIMLGQTILMGMLSGSCPWAAVASVASDTQTAQVASDTEAEAPEGQSRQTESGTSDAAADALRRAGQEITRRLEELRQQLAAATEAGKQELAARVRQEIKDYVLAQAQAQIAGARRRAEQVVAQQYDWAEQRIRQLEQQGGAAVTEEWLEKAWSLLRSDHLAARIGDLQAEARSHHRAVQELLDAGQAAQARQRVQQLAVTLDRLVLAEQYRDSDTAESLEWEPREQLLTRLFYLRSAEASLVQLEMYDVAQRMQREAARIQLVLDGQEAAPSVQGADHGDPIEQQLQAIQRRLDEICRRLDRFGHTDQTRASKSEPPE